MEDVMRQSVSRGVPASGMRLWAGRIAGAIAVLFLLLDSLMKMLKMPPAVEGTTQLGFPEGTVAPIGIVLLVCVVPYVIPRTAALGAVLLTGYLGGAVAAQVRVASPLFATWFPIGVAALVWTGLVLRDDRLRALFSRRGAGRERLE